MGKFVDILNLAPRKRVVVAPPGGKGEAVTGELSDYGFPVAVVEGGEEAVKKAYRLLCTGEADILLQGGIELERLFSILEEEGVKREDLCFVSVFEDIKRGKLLLIADTYIHDFPDLALKVKILNRTVELARILGISEPKVAVLSSIEMVNPSIPSTIEGAALSKMSERRQVNAVVEGPLDIDCALSREAAARKGVNSQVPGNVDILLCPDIESGYTLSQFLTFFGRLPTAGVLLGTPRPVVINPRFIPVSHKVVEVAMGAILVEG